MRRATETSEATLQDARRQTDVTKLIEMFEQHQHKEQFLKDMSQKQEINKFSKESKKYSTTRTKQISSNLCENSAKLQCLDCNAFSEIGIIYCSCGRNLKCKRNPTTLQKTNCDFTSFPDFVIRRIPVGDQNTVHLKERWGFSRQRRCLKKSKTRETWEPSDDSRNMVCTWEIPKVIGGAQFGRNRSHVSRSHRTWKTRLYSYTSWTVAERQILDSSFECWWVPKASSSATMHWQCLKMQDARLAETHQSLRPIRPEHQQHQLQDQQFGWENFDYYVDRKTMRLAQELHCHLCAPEKSLVFWSDPCLIHGWSLSHLPCATSTSSSSFTLPSTTQEHAARSVQHVHFQNTPYIPDISKLLHSTSCAIKNHSGMKTWRVVETRARQLPQVMRTESLRLSQRSKIVLGIQNNRMMYRKIVEKQCTELPSPKKKKFGEIDTAGLPDNKISRTFYFQSKMHSTIP